METTSTPGDSDDDDDVPDNAASASSSDASQLPAGASGPPDGKPLFARVPEFVAVYLVFATDVLVCMGEMPGEVHQYYLAALRSVQPNMADAYEDTTTLKLVRERLSGEEITKDALYNLIVGQTVLSSWRRLEAFGPFS